VSSEVAAALKELKRRARARESLHSYAMNVDIPTVPFEAPCPDESVEGPAALLMARHHAAILGCLQRTANRPMGRCMIFAPPGSAKSLYTSVLLPTWEMGRRPGSRIILASYQSTLAERQSRRAIQICASDKYKVLWPEAPVLTSEAAHQWSLSNKSEMIATGMLGGVTGNRANAIIIDDPVSGREDADSELMRQKTLDAYKDDLLTRLLPNGWVAFIMTRWHEQDLAGAILPDDYDGRSGLITCKDGLEWEILNIPARAERADDPLGRRPGEYLWPEFYPDSHWQMFENAAGPESARTWSSLYQQRPTPQGSGRFTEDMFDFYKPGTEPPYMAYVGAGDYAVTEGKNDFTELGVFGVDPAGELWEVDWWSKQSATDESTEKTLDMIKRWRIPMWFNEGGVIDKAMGPLINLRMRQRRIFADRRALPSMADKVAKCMSFQGRAAAKTVHFRDNANSRRVVGQLCALPAGRYDDAADVCGLVGRAVDQFPVARAPQEKKRDQLIPFSAKWLEFEEKTDPARRYR
jgi:hypothetical protein